MVLRIVGYLRPYKGQVALIMITVGISSAIGLIPALMLRAVIDVAIPNRDGVLLATYVLGMVGAAVVGGLIGVAQTSLNTQISQRVMLDIRGQLYRHLQSLSLRFFTSVKTGEIMSRLNNDVSGINRIVSETMTQTVMQVLLLATTMALMFALEWRLALLSIVVVPLLLLPTRRVGAMRQVLQRETQRKHADLTAMMQETLNISGFLLMKAFVQEAYEALRFGTQSGALMDVQIRTSMLGRWFRMLLQVFEALGPAMIYLVGGFMVISSEMSLGTVLAFVALLHRLYGPISQLANVHVEIMGSLALFERIFEYLDIRPDIVDAPGARPFTSHVRGHVAFRNVSFEYLPGRRVLDRVTLEVEPGQLAALLGPSGAGKTTATYLVPRFYDVTGGSIEIDGRDIREVTVASLRAYIGIVTQETYLFNASVGENLRYAKLDATDEEIARACSAARLDGVIADLPHGYDTIVGERGYRLSGGEKQRLAIARVILKDPQVLILDEATSSLDSQTEAQIQAALAPLMRDRTTIAIAHRLSTVLAADRLFVLDRGQIVESGTHSELLAKGDLYAQLYETQFKPQLRDAVPAV